jgi:hypothetical protein
LKELQCHQGHEESRVEGNSMIWRSSVESAEKMMQSRIWRHLVAAVEASGMLIEDAFRGGVM